MAFSFATASSAAIMPVPTGPGFELTIKVAMPISLGTAFGLHWNLYGLWTGVAIALAL